MPEQRLLRAKEVASGNRAWGGQIGEIAIAVFLSLFSLFLYFFNHSCILI